MSKFLAKVIKKFAFLSGVIAGLIIAATIVGIFVGFNGMPTVTDGIKVTVNVEQYLYKTESAKDEIKSACDKAFEDNNVLYVIDGDLGGDGEFVYAFKKGEDVSAAVAELQATFADWTAEDSEKYPTNTIIVSVSNEKVQVVTAKGFVLRAAIAATVITVLAFAYVAIRHNWRSGVVAAISVAASMLLTGAIIIVTRIPVTVSVAYAIMASALFTIVIVLLNANKLRNALKSEDRPSSAEELIVSTVAWKEIAVFSSILGAAILLVCIPTGVSGAWFALSAFIGLAVATFIGLIYAPALCLPFQQAADAKAASATKHGYKGAKKAEKNATAKVEPKKEEVKEEPVETPVEETEVVEETEETPVEPETVSEDEE